MLSLERNPEYLQWEEIFNILNMNKSLLFQWEEILNIFNWTKSLIHTEHGLTHRKTTSYCLAQHRVTSIYLLAKIGVDTAENEPLKVHLIFKLWDLIFTEPPPPAPPTPTVTSASKRNRRVSNKARYDMTSDLKHTAETKGTVQPIPCSSLKEIAQTFGSIFWTSENIAFVSARLEIRSCLVQAQRAQSHALVSIYVFMSHKRRNYRSCVSSRPCFPTPS